MNPEVGIIVVAIVLATVALIVLAFKHLYVRAQPDQWLLSVRNGKLNRAGIGIATLRHPGDVVVRFTSTVQRVRFEVEAMSKDRIKVILEGFVLWSVSTRGEDPFVAYRKLGLVNLSLQRDEMSLRKHLLTTPQHRAFRKLIGAEVQRHALTLELETLLLNQDLLLKGITSLS